MSEYRDYSKRPNRKNYMGYVKMWNREKNYGFVYCYDDEESYFCSQRATNGEPYLERGSIVNFQIGHGVDREGEPTSYAYNLLMVEEPAEKKRKRKK